MIDVDAAERKAHEASEHLLQHHANMDRGTLITDQIKREPTTSFVMRDSFNSPCTQPNECWNRLEVAIRALRSAAFEAGLEAAATEITRLAPPNLADCTVIGRTRHEAAVEIRALAESANGE